MQFSETSPTSSVGNHGVEIWHIHQHVSGGLKNGWIWETDCRAALVSLDQFAWGWTALVPSLGEGNDNQQFYKWHFSKVASNKVSTKVKAISFAENGSYFVTAGNRWVVVKYSMFLYGVINYFLGMLNFGILSTLEVPNTKNPYLWWADQQFLENRETTIFVMWPAEGEKWWVSFHVIILKNSKFSASNYK